jgi:putative NIF3 family GTP cyclohydrolase 1 type 2
MTTTEEMMRLAIEMAYIAEVPADSAIHVQGKGVTRVLFGIDAGVPELLLARQLGYNCVISHHPQGNSAVIDFWKVFERHIDQMVQAGVPRRKAEDAVRKKQSALEVEMHTRNYGHAVSVAKLLKMPYMNIHTPLDEIGRRRMMEQISVATKSNPKAKVAHIVTALDQLPEFKNAQTRIQIRLGKSSNRAGKVVVSHGAGTNGGYEVAKTYFEHGIDTVIYIHISPADLETLRKDGVGNLIVTGHIASDSVGINPFIFALEQNGVTVTRIGIIPP